jgi:hypothetical protein
MSKALCIRGIVDACKDDNLKLSSELIEIQEKEDKNYRI